MRYSNHIISATQGTFIALFSRQLFIVGLLLAGLGLAGCAPAAELRFQQAYVKAPVPGKDLSAAYARITNNTAAQICLADFAADFANKVELHSTSRVGDQVRMQRLAELCIDPGTTAALEPGGMHFMLIGVADLTTRETPLVIELQDSQQKRYPIKFDLRAFDAPHQ